MSVDSTKWIGVEATKNGFPVLTRIRGLAPDPSLKIVFVVTWVYPEDHPSRLPPSQFYSSVERFQRSVVTEIEEKGIGVLVASETGLGATKWYFYTNSTDTLASVLDGLIPVAEKVEFASDADPEWREYIKYRELAGI